MDFLILALSIFFIIMGLAGIILPFLPGLVFVYLGVFIYALKTGFETISLFVIIVFFIATILFLLFDFLSPLFGAKKYKAGKYGIIGAFLGTFFGLFTLGPLGIIIGPFLGAFIGEVISGKDNKLAFNSAFGALMGLIFGTLLKLILALIMTGFFIISFFR